MDMNPEEALALREDLNQVKGDLTVLQGGMARVQGDVTQLQEGMARVQGDVTQLQEGMARVQGDVTQLQEGMARVQGDVAQLQGGMARVQGDVTLLREDMTQVKDDLKAFTRKFAIEIVKIHASGEKRDELIRTEMRVLASNITTQIDGYMSNVGKIDRAQIIADWRMTQLEGRVDKIESRPS